MGFRLVLRDGGVDAFYLAKAWNQKSREAQE
jgi:hypothetical protein